MDHLHKRAFDVASSSIDSSTRHRLTHFSTVDSHLQSNPISRHILFKRHLANECVPSFAPSYDLPPSQGVSVEYGVDHEENSVATDSKANGSQHHPLVFRHLQTRSWFARPQSSFISSPLPAPPSAPLQEWAGFEIGNRHRFHHRHVEWHSQNYLVKQGVEQVFDHSLFVKVNQREDARPKTVPSNPISAAAQALTSYAIHDTSSITLLSTCTANLAGSNFTLPDFSTFPPSFTSDVAQPVDPASAPSLLYPKANLLSLGFELGYHSHLRNPWMTKVFGSTDGLMLGFGAGKMWKRGERRVEKYATTSSSSSSSSSISSILTSFLNHLPSFQFNSTSVGMDFAWIQEEKDYSAAFGLAQQFRWKWKEESKTQNSDVKNSGLLTSSSSLSPPPPLSPPSLPPSTLALTMQFYGHLTASLHVPLTHRFTLSSTYHSQLTNHETLMTMSGVYELNERQKVTAIVDSRGGVRIGVSATSRRKNAPQSNMIERFFSHLNFSATVSASPILPQLAPSWNASHTTIVGANPSSSILAPILASSSSAAPSRLSFGFGVEYDAE